MQKKLNVAPLIAHMRDFLTGSDKAEGGRAALSLDMVAYLSTPFVYSFLDGDDVRVTDDFVVSDLVLNKPRNADGSDNKALQGRRRVVVLTDLFGLDPDMIPHKMQTALDKLIPEAIALRWRYEGSEHAKPANIRMVKVFGDVNGTQKQVLGGIAARDMFDLVDDKGELTALGRKSLRVFPALYRAAHKRDAVDEATLTAFMCAYPVEADGRGHMFFDGTRALTSAKYLDKLVEQARAAKVLPAKAVRVPAAGGTDKGKAVSEAAALVVSSLDAVLTTDESAVPFGDDLAKLLDTVVARWAAYRAKYPATAPELPLD